MLIVAGGFGIIKDLGMDFDISGELEYVKNAMLHHSGRDYAASRGEYLNGIILATYLDFTFIDAAEVIFFDENGVCHTVPTIHTDNESLLWLCDTPMVGSITGWERGVVIHLCREA